MTNLPPLHFCLGVPITIHECATRSCTYTLRRPKAVLECYLNVLFKNVGSFWSRWNHKHVKIPVESLETPPEGSLLETLLLKGATRHFWEEAYLIFWPKLGRDPTNSCLVSGQHSLPWLLSISNGHCKASPAASHSFV